MMKKLFRVLNMSQDKNFIALSDRGTSAMLEACKFSNDGKIIDIQSFACEEVPGNVVEIKESKSKYIVVGGNPFRGYTQTLSFTSLKIVGKTNSEEEVKKIVEDYWDECGGLLMVIDAETGEEATV